MDEFVDILQKLADILRWLILTPKGLWVLGIFLASWLALNTTVAVLNQARLCKAADKKMRFCETAVAIFTELSNCFLKFVSVIPTLVAVVLVSLSLIGVSSAINRVTTFVTNEQHIKELKTVIKHLDTNYKLAEIDVKKVEKINDSHKTTLEISFFDYLGNKEAIDSQKITIEGNELYLDCMVCNFDYSEIETGKSVNLAFPFKLYSNKISQENGVDVAYMNEDGIPYMYLRNEDDIYGIDGTVFYDRLKELITIINDSEKRKSAGIRSFYASAPHKVVETGDKLLIYVEQSGGLSLTKKSFF